MRVLPCIFFEAVSDRLEITSSVGPAAGRVPAPDVEGRNTGRRRLVSCEVLTLGSEITYNKDCAF